MMELGDTALIVLAAGLSSRFGSDKLSADLDGRPLALHVLTALHSLEFGEKVIVARGQEWTRDYLAAGFDVLQNATPELGQSHSLRMGLDATRSPRVMILLADMPFIKTESILKLAELFQSSAGRPVATGLAQAWGPPVIFCRSSIDPGHLVGDVGARKLLVNPVVLQVDAASTIDVDHPQHLVR